MTQRDDQDMNKRYAIQKIVMKEIILQKVMKCTYASSQMVKIPVISFYDETVAEGIAAGLTLLDQIYRQME